MSEQALTELVQKTFDAVQNANAKLDSMNVSLLNLEGRHVEQVKKQDRDDTAVNRRLDELARDHAALKLDVATLRASRLPIAGGAAVGGGALGALLKLLLGGLLIVAVTGCSGASNYSPRVQGMSGRCAADLALSWGSEPINVHIDAQGTYASGGDALDGVIRLEGAGLVVECVGKPGEPPVCTKHSDPAAAASSLGQIMRFLSGQAHD